jgi:hypothetical protein
MDDRIIKKDNFIMFTSGSYSDYGVDCFCKVKIDINLSSLFKEWKSEKSPESFLGWLNKKNLFDEIEYCEINTNS